MVGVQNGMARWGRRWPGDLGGSGGWRFLLPFAAFTKVWGLADAGVEILAGPAEAALSPVTVGLCGTRGAEAFDGRWV